MCTVLTALLAGVIATACRSGGTSSVTPIPGDSPTPLAVLRLAHAYLASLTGKHADDRDYVREDFCRSFFEGFTMPDATTSGGTEAGRQGFLAGQQYRRANPTRIEETMKGFGYTAIEHDGVWTVSFEHSAFRPDKQPTQTWWLSYFGDSQSDLPKDTKIPDNGVRIGVSGYLSPSGRFGHLGRYDHEFFATRLSKIGG